MIIRKKGTYYGIHEGRMFPIVAWHFYANSGCVLAEPNEPYDYFPNVWLNHVIMQADEGVLVDGEMRSTSWQTP